METAFHGTWLGLHLSGLGLAVKIAWDAAGKPGAGSKVVFVGAVLYALLSAVSAGHHARRCYGH